MNACKRTGYICVRACVFVPVADFAIYFFLAMFVLLLLLFIEPGKWFMLIMLTRTWNTQQSQHRIRLQIHTNYHFANNVRDALMIEAVHDGNKSSEPQPMPVQYVIRIRICANAPIDFMLETKSSKKRLHKTHKIE